MTFPLLSSSALLKIREDSGNEDMLYKKVKNDKLTLFFALMLVKLSVTNVD